VTKQPKLRALCRQIFCKSEIKFLYFSRAHDSCVGAYWPRRTRDMTRHEFLVKKFEREPLQAVQSNRLRRFGRLHEFF
jgi:hypothetical protein